MSFWTKIILSSFVNALLVALTSAAVLLEGVTEFDEVVATKWAMLFIGAAMAFLKDIVAALSDTKPIVEGS